MTNQEKLKQLKARIISDNPCPDLSESAKQLVFGTGDVDADIMFIGEAPGKKEDETGKPFVGASGKFLDELLKSIKLERSDTYITNIVKYRPPDNRDPKPEEKEAFWPYLLEQISIIKPKIVATLGRHSGQAFIKSLRISVDHGKPQKLKLNYSSFMGTGGKRVDGVQGDNEKRTEAYKSTLKGASQLSTQQSATNLYSADGKAVRQIEVTLTILPLYHPAAALYNGSLKRTLLEDFGIINKLIK